MTTITEIKIPMDHPVFDGHFPGNPIVPGVLLLDEALYAIARLTGECLDRCTLPIVKFMSIVRPNQLVTLQFEAKSLNAIQFKLIASGRIVAKGCLRLVPDNEVSDAH